ncbi:MAG: hypothetical protein P9L88_05350 [Candidatus Tantalella remota]|nr:hypothetical protein [Candidatus Tantalella remota]
MKKIMIILLMLSLMVSVHAQEAEKSDESMDSLMSVIVTDDASIREEAVQLGIPVSQQKKFVYDMREINKQYQQGSLTRTEYIGAKRSLIENSR